MTSPDSDFESMSRYLRDAQTKLDVIRAIVDEAFEGAQRGDDLCDGEGPLTTIREVLDR